MTTTQPEVKMIHDPDIPSSPITTSLRTEVFPTTWCGGCGIGITLHAYLRAVERLNLDIEKDIVTISGIGCSGRVSGYVKGDGFHTTHGRAIAFALGVKTTQPRLKVVVFSGDGDLISIGGNHFIHTAHRNVDINVICINNATYGMTGGQIAPTTFHHAITPTSGPHGTLRYPFNLAFLAKSAGAQYIARASVTQHAYLERVIAEALQSDGFSFVEVISPCPVLFGRINRVSLQDMYKTLQDATVKATDEELEYPELAEMEFETGIGYVRVPYGVFKPMVEIREQKHHQAADHAEGLESSEEKK
jgi:2-oxoglutarate ferredoxin oxidoreductase subunit beta